MATAVGLNFQITASSVGMTQGVNDAASQLGKLGTAAQKAASDLGVLRTIEIGRAFISSVQTVASSFGNYVRGIDQSVESTSNLARELGISYNELTALQLAAQLSGASTEDLARAFTKAQVTITKAANGGKEAAASLAAIGLSARDFEGLSSSEQFTLLATAINNISDPAQRAAAAVEIFGKSGAQLLPVFRELGENLQTSQALLAQFNGGVSQEQVNSVNAIGDAFDKVTAAIKIVATQALASLAPQLTQVSNEFITFLASLDISSVAATASSVISGIGGALTIVYEVASLLSPVISAVGNVIAFIGDNAKSVAIGFTAAAGAMTLYQAGAIAASIATTGLAGAVRALVSSTGIGLVVTVLGTVAAAAVEWGFSSSKAGEQAKKAADGVASSTATAANSARKLGADAAESQRKAFVAAEEASKKAAEAAKRAADTARREADAAIQRVTVEQQFGGDSQRYAAAQAVEAIQADILRTQQEIEDARKAGDRDAINAGAARLAQLDQALKREQDIASGARKAAEQRLKLEQDYARAREAFDERRLSALARPSTELLQLEDVRTASGYAALQRFSADQSDDPAIQEYRKQLKELQAIRKKIGEVGNQAETVDILGA